MFRTFASNNNAKHCQSQQKQLLYHIGIELASVQSQRKGHSSMNIFEVRAAIKAARLMQYEIAAQIGISEYTFCKWLRKELTEEQRKQVYSAIAALKAGEVHA